MYNWSTDTNKLKKHKNSYKIWELEQRINYGLQDAKLTASEVKKYWHKLNIDKAKRNVLKFWLWPTS